MSPVEGPIVTVTFYDNFHQIDTSSVGISPLGTYFDEDEFIHRQWKVLVIASAGSYTLGLASDYFTVPEEPTTRTTGSIAWDASASSIAAALQAISETQPNGNFFEWTGFKIGDGEYLLDSKAAIVGGQQKLPQGALKDNGSLSGHVIWDWDEIDHKVPLTPGGCASNLPEPEISPEGAQQGRRAKDRPVTGGNA